MILRIGVMTAALCAVLCGGTAAAGEALLITANGHGFVKPVIGAHITQGFGCTPFTLEVYDPSCPSRHFHSGIDLAAPAGTPVFATLPGTVTVILSPGGYGLHVVIDHGGGLSSLYGHLSAVDVSTGEVVAAGEQIGAVGSTGNSTGPHLHFEIRRDGIPEDPMLDVSLP